MTSHANGSVVEKLRPFVDYLEQLGKPAGFERSFKISSAGVQGGRATVVTDPAALDPRHRQLLADLQTALQFPAVDQPAFDFWLKHCGLLHLGYELTRSAGLMFKIYLEFPYGKAGVPDNLLCAAYKWAPGMSTCLSTHYSVWPGDQAARWQWGDDAEAFEDPIWRDIWKSIQPLTQALPAERLPEHRVPLLIGEAREANGRSSVDLNTHRLNLRLEQIDGLVAAVAKVCSLDPEALAFDPLVLEAGVQVLDHIVAGTGREGEPFVSFYYGLKEVLPGQFEPCFAL
ncbi:MAG: hypothetical protein ACPGYX_01870 [Oceanobacter sp.]